MLALANESSPVPAFVVNKFLELNPASLEEIWFKVSIIAICQNKRISGKVLDLFLKKGPKKCLEPIVRKRLISHTIASENKEVLNILINRFPHVLSQKASNEIPLTHCLSSSPAILDLVLKEGINNRVEGIGGLFMENDCSETFFSRLIKSFESPNNANTIARRMNWKRLEVCLKHVYLDIEDSSLMSSRIPFCCVCFIPSHLIDEALQILQFDEQSSDVYHMIYIATSNDKWRERMQLGFVDFARMIERIINLTERNNSNQRYRDHPLYYAAYRGLRWEGGLKAILNSDVNAIMVQGLTTNLFPFMAAACGSASVLDNIFRLLLRDPSVVVHQTKHQA